MTPAPHASRRKERSPLRTWGNVAMWAGIAVVFLGFGACGFSCVGTAVSIGTGISGDTAGAMATRDAAGTAGVISMWMMGGGLGLAVLGGILKAVAGR